MNNNAIFLFLWFVELLLQGTTTSGMIQPGSLGDLSHRYLHFWNIIFAVVPSWYFKAYLIGEIYENVLVMLTTAMTVMSNDWNDVLNAIVSNILTKFSKKCNLSEKS